MKRVIILLMVLVTGCAPLQPTTDADMNLSQDTSGVLLDSCGCSMFNSEAGAAAPAPTKKARTLEPEAPDDYSSGLWF